MGGRGSGSNMNASTSGGGSFMSNQRNMADYAIATGALDMGSEAETRRYIRTAEGKAALQEFMDGEREAGLTAREMRDAIKSAGSGTYQESDVPSRVQSFTTIGTGVSGDYESRTYVTRNGDAIKTTTKYSDGTRTTSTDMKNYPQYPETNRSRAQFEKELAGMAKARIRTGSDVLTINGKKKK